MGFHTHPHLRGGSLCFLTVSVTSCERSLGMALPDTWTIPVSYVCTWRRVTGRKTPWRSRRQWKERLRNMSEQKAAATWGWLQGEHSFILTVNLNLDEVQCIPRLCFKTKAKYLSFQLGWNTGRQKKRIINLVRSIYEWDSSLLTIPTIQTSEYHTFMRGVGGVGLIPGLTPRLAPHACTSAQPYTDAIHMYVIGWCDQSLKGSATICLLNTHSNGPERGRKNTHSLLCKHALAEGEGSLNAAGRDAWCAKGGLRGYRKNVPGDASSHTSCSGNW